MGWRDADIIPRYGAAGVRKFATVIDLANALAGGQRQNLLGNITDVTWLILAF